MRAPAPGFPVFHRARDAGAFYGMSEEALRRWKRIGLSAGDPFPLENPAEALRWYQRHHTKGVPARLAEAVRRWSGGRAR